MLLNILTDLATAVCLLGAIFLFIRGKNNRARKMLAYTLLIWGLCCVGRSVCLHLDLIYLILQPLRPVGLLGGNFFIVVILFFPTEVMLPGWLNFKRFVKLLVPAALLALIYWAGLFITGQEVEKINSFSEFSSTFFHFNVWFRLSFLLLVIFYCFSLLRLVYRYEKKYVRWKNDNYADVEYMDMSWLKYYAMGALAIFGVWLLNVFIAQEWTFILHSIVTIVCFSYFIYKALFYESAYPEDYFKNTEDNPIVPALAASAEDVPGESCDTVSDDPDNASFEDKIPAYVEAFNEWMDKEKPYLYKDFKLTDVSRVLPLNRSYLSRVLNEGLGMNFCQVVRKYRVEASKKVLKDSPELPIYMVAEQCGFSSDTTFIRAFQQEMKMTPSRYRMEN